jgi:murein DD-endopeptidase MepM/ murein hydrolase activator NlpD
VANWSYDPSYRLTSPFGMRKHPITGKDTFHRGVDLVITPGNGPLHAFVAGTVMYAAMGKPGNGIPAEMGIVVAIKDDKGYLHLYAHLSAAIVKVGQKVAKGQMVGNQGTTGVDVNGKPTSTGNHLHYEIRKAASPNHGWTATEAGVVEPTKYLQDYYKPAAPVVVPPKVEVKPKMNKEDANKIIAFLSASYAIAQDKASRDENRRLANELRIASGQPTQ